MVLRTISSSLARRKLLTAALAAPAIIRAWPRDALAFPRGGNNEIYTPAQPAPAAEWNYNILTFWDDFTSASTIDTGFTQAFGYNWYQPHGLFPENVGTSNAVAAPINISVANSVVTLSGTSKNLVVEARRGESSQSDTRRLRNSACAPTPRPILEDMSAQLLAAVSISKQE
jgi:hypothetical protein